MSSDPQRWFQEIVIDKGHLDGITTESAVVAVFDGREGMVGRVSDVLDHTSKVLLIQDSLSSIAARLQGSVSEDGVIEGTNGHDVIFKYLDRSSPVKVGDFVVTAGLGNRLPAEIPIGWVEEISLDPRQLFLQARLRSAISSNRLRIVLVLIPGDE
jgi:rod shape-determining protein MreC